MSSQQVEKIRLVVLASGGGSNLQAILDAIAGGALQAEVVGVISDVEHAYALERARHAGIPAYFIDFKDFYDRDEYEHRIIELCNELSPHYICLAGYMRLVGKGLLATYQDRILNIHPSLLPAFPGLAAQKQAFDHGVKVAGCTVHFVDQGMDTGPIIAQQVVPVLEDDDEAALAKRILAAEHQLYPGVLQLLAENRVQLVGRKVHINQS